MDLYGSKNKSHESQFNLFLAYTSIVHDSRCDYKGIVSLSVSSLSGLVLLLRDRKMALIVSKISRGMMSLF